jgi:hypothetical protein
MLNMTAVPFIGTPPNDEAALIAVRATFGRFDRVKNNLLNVDLKHFSQLEKDKLAEGCEVDRFLVDDIIDVLDGSVKAFLDPRASGVFWTFGRQSPRWGMPWASITLDGTGACYLNIRWGGTFDDVEDPPKTVRCNVVLDSMPDGSNIEDLLFSSEELDCWVRLEDSSLNGFLVIDRTSDGIKSTYREEKNLPGRHPTV